MYNVQGLNCLNIITVPIRFLPRLADAIKRSGRYSRDVAIMWNPGRCGSTVISRVVNTLPNIVSMSEVDFISYPIASKIRNRIDSQGNGQHAQLYFGMSGWLNPSLK